MRTLIITVAGTATRFNRDTEMPILKCLYYSEKHYFSLLSQILLKANDYDRFVIVGGYLFDRLKEFVEIHLSEFRHRIHLVYNPFYETYGSGYSLIKGIEACGDQTEEVVFVEGDLYFDMNSFDRVTYSDKDVLTVNSEFICADTAVAFYINAQNRARYIYDTSHRSLIVSEPFKAIYNSAQVWKFCSLEKLKEVVRNLSESRRTGTNLEIIQDYFGDMDLSLVDILPFHVWRNCNTVADYMKILPIIKEDARTQ